MDDETMQLLKVLREQLGKTSASRTVDALAAANFLVWRGLPRVPPSPTRSGPGQIPRGTRKPRTEHAGEVFDYLGGSSSGRQSLAPLQGSYKARSVNFAYIGFSEVRRP